MHLASWLLLFASLSFDSYAGQNIDFVKALHDLFPKDAGNGVVLANSSAKKLFNDKEQKDPTLPNLAPGRACGFSINPLVEIDDDGNAIKDKNGKEIVQSYLLNIAVARPGTIAIDQDEAESFLFPIYNDPSKTPSEPGLTVKWSSQKNANEITYTEESKADDHATNMSITVKRNQNSTIFTIANLDAYEAFENGCTEEDDCKNPGPKGKFKEILNLSCEIKN